MASPLMPDPYHTLGVAKDATLANIRSAHRKLVLTCHPDKVYDDSVKSEKAEMFHQVQRAYEVLSDESRRQRYDDRVKLAELRADVMKDTGSSSKTKTYTFGDRPPARTTSSTFEVRGGRVYEERAPRRSYEDESTSPRSYEPVSSKKKYTDDFDHVPSRRVSGRAQEEKRKAREYEDEKDKNRMAREYIKTAERAAQADRKKSRDKDRRKGYDDKYVPKAAYVEAYSESSDSESTFVPTKRNPEPTRRRDENYKKVKDDNSRRSSKRNDSDYSDDLESKYHSARDYIARASGKVVEAEPSPRRSGYRTVSSADVRKAVPPAPPPPPPPPVESTKRSSARSRGTRTTSRARSSGKERKDIEVVDPSPNRLHETSSASRKVPPMPTASSSPSSLKNLLNPSGRREGPHRSATMQPLVESPKHQQFPSIRRAETSPLVGMVSSPRRDSATKISSKLKNAETHDSGYSSPGTPELNATLRSTKYQYSSGEDNDGRGPRTVLVEPEEYERERDISPRATLPRRSSERPSGSTRGSSSARVTPARSTSYAQAPEAIPSPRHAPPFIRTESGRAPPPPPMNRSSTRDRLYGEVVDSPKPYEIRYAKPLVLDDEHYNRRGSDGSHRDAYPFNAERKRGLGRNASYQQQDAVY
ncbi:hypothetical protein MMC09_003153 [Bachmanniomyces sp. S44760]|nr:hypothetical protein [Bachmanniomyces sp. S44760]